MTCREAIWEVFQDEDGVLATTEVIERVNARYPAQPWKRSTVTAHLIGLSVNHSSRRHYPYLWDHGILFSLGNGRYRRWNPDKDGTWVVTKTGVRLVDDVDDTEPSEDARDSETPSTVTAVSLERDLEACLLGDLGRLEPGLRLYEEDEITGQQFNTGAVGRIDILAVDARGNYVVIELKAGTADERVCGQILRYMGWVKREIAGGKPIRGIIVANEFRESVKYAAEAIPNVTLKHYEVSFHFANAQGDSLGL